MTPPRFARVVPLCRTPVGIDAFDYLLPEQGDFAPGDLVRVPLRKQFVEGVIIALLSDSPFAAKTKAICSDAPITQFGRDWVDLLEWMSARTFQSSATVAKAWLRLLPKKLKPWTTILPHRADLGTAHAEWITTPESVLVERVRAQSGRTIVLVPLAQQAIRIAEALGCHSLLSDDPKTVATSTWSSFLEHETGVIVTTRVGAWLGLFADEIVLLEPENDEHKQDELSPRFDARLVAAWLQQRKHASLFVVGRTPPIHVDTPAPAIDLHPQLSIRQWQGRSAVPGICLDAVEKATPIDHEPLVIIHPIRGLRARCQCRVCGFVVACEKCGSALRREQARGWCDVCKIHQFLPDECPTCGGQDFSGSPAGLELLKQEWLKNDYPQCADWRDGSPLALDTPFPQNTSVLVTEPHLLGGAAEDIRRTERLCRAYRLLASRVAEVGGRLTLQIHEGDTDRWLHWLTPEGVQKLNTDERTARTIFRYPPSVRLAKILIDTSEVSARALAEQIKTKLARDPAFLEMRGPFFAEQRPKSRPRIVLHLLFRPETNEATLIKLLSPFARQAKIDLDAVAFLR